MNVNYPSNKTVDIYLKQEFFDMIKSGEKTLELRVRHNVFADIETGDSIIFRGQNDSVEALVSYVRQYKNIEEVGESEDISKLAPGMSEEEAQIKAKQLFNENDIAKYGLVVIEFKLL